LVGCFRHSQVALQPSSGIETSPNKIEVQD